jgi:Cu-processing system ATP-binding protein
MSAPAIRLDGVVKRFGRARALDGVSLNVAPGEALALLGHNGAGKTTLMKLALGLLRPDEGALEVLGGAPTRDGAWRRAVGFLPESLAFPDAMTGREMLAFYARLKGEPVAETLGLLDRVGLAEAARRRVKTYSKGMRQRLGLAQALLGRPRLLMLDEPTSGLDPILRGEFYDMLEELRGHGTTVVLASHALTEVEARTDRVAILRHGKLVAWDSLDGLRAQAGLAARIRFKAAGRTDDLVARLGGRFALERVNDTAVELSCPVSEKAAVMQLVGAAGLSVDDIDIVLPGLDDVYAHFGRTEEGGA